MSMQNAFNMGLKITERDAMIARIGSFTEADLKISISNYSRNMSGPEDMVIKGREFIVSTTNLNAISFPIPLKRGDVIIDPDFGDMRITEVRVMPGLKGEILGYRVRAE